MHIYIYICIYIVIHMNWTTTLQKKITALTGHAPSITCMHERHLVSFYTPEGCPPTGTVPLPFCISWYTVKHMEQNQTIKTWLKGQGNFGVVRCCSCCKVNPHVVRGVIHYVHLRTHLVHLRTYAASVLRVVSGLEWVISISIRYFFCKQILFRSLTQMSAQPKDSDEGTFFVYIWFLSAAQTQDASHI